MTTETRGIPGNDWAATTLEYLSKASRLTSMDAGAKAARAACAAALMAVASEMHTQNLIAYMSLPDMKSHRETRYKARALGQIITRLGLDQEGED